MWRDAVLVAGKDLRIEGRSRVTSQQVLPFAVLVLALFAFALDAEGVLRRAAPGLFWIAVLLASMLAAQRSFAIETDDRALDGLRLAGLDPAGIFLGKAGAIAIQLVALEVALTVGVAILYDSPIRASGIALLITTCLLATAGLAATGACYGALSAGVRGRETLLPLLYLPVASPVLLAGTRAIEAALGVTPGLRVGEGWPWVRLLGVFAALYVAFGVLAFGALLEET